MPGSFNFCGPTHYTRDGLWAYERCVNYVPSPDEGGHAKSKVSLLGTPGIVAFSTLGTTPVRGLWAGDERLFAVGGDTLYEIDSSGTAAAVDNPSMTALDGTTPVQISSNGNQLFIVAGAKGYIDDGTDVTEVVPAVSGCYLDGYFVALTPSSNEIRISGLLDGTTWDALDTHVETTAHDRLIRLMAHQGQLWCFGLKTVRVYYHSGNVDFPFERVSGATIDAGTIAAWSVAQVGASLLWLGTDERGIGVVYQSQGESAKRVSTSGIEYLIEQIRLTYGSTPLNDDVTAYCYQEDGHTFYVLNFPTASWTVAYDLTTGLWHERLRWDSGTSLWKQWRGGGFHAFCFGKHFVANIGYSSGIIYQQALSLYSDAGDAIGRYRIAPYVSNDQQWVYHHYLKLHLLGTPSVVMRYSDDSGATWSSAKTVTAATNLATYRRLGRARNRLYEVRIDSSSAYQSVVDAYLHGTGAIES